MTTLLYLLDILVRLLLVVASTASFVPQISRIKHDGDCAGISVLCILFNLIVATYNFSLLLATAIDWEGSFLSEQPPDGRDWLNHAQFAVVWLGQLVLFYLVVTLPPHRLGQTRTAVIAYLSFLAISLIPAVGQALIPRKEREITTALFLCTLLFMVGPVVQLLGIAAMRAQARETRSRGSAGALSVQSLVIQAVVFLLVGISFAFRLKLPVEALDEHFIVNVREWYWLVGWATINNVIFALAQGWLAWMVSRLRNDDDGERDALLA